MSPLFAPVTRRRWLVALLLGLALGHSGAGSAPGSRRGLLGPRPLFAQEAAARFRAGAVAVDVTPEKLPVDSPGYFQATKADVIHDPLHVRCLALDDGTTRIAIVICDFCMIPRELLDAAKERAAKATGLSMDRILAAATHTHSSVTLAPTFQSEVEIEYGEFLTAKIAEAVEQALAQLEPARVGWAVGHNPRQVFNRRWHLRPGPPLVDPFDLGTDRVQMNPSAAGVRLLKPAGPVDPDVAVLAVQSTSGRPIGLLANYSLHYVGGVPAKTLSADYFGEFARQISALVAPSPERSGGGSSQPAPSPPFVGILSNGTSGDVNNINFFEGSTKREPLEQMRLVAADLAGSAYSAYRRIEWREHATLAMRETEVDLKVRRPSEEELARARKILTDAGKGPYGDLRTIYALETTRLAEYPATVRVKLQALRIGDLGICATPCETFVETGLSIKRESPLPMTFTIELANGYNGYLPTPEQHALGGYETWRARSSYLAVDAEPAVRKTLLKLLQEVAQEAQ